MVTTTSEVLSKKWLSPEHEKIVYTTVPPEMVKFVKIAPHGGIAYLNHYDNTIRVRRENALLWKKSPKGAVVDVDLYENDISVAHFVNGEFRISHSKIRENVSWELLPPVHRFPILKSFFYSDLFIIAVSTDGFLSLTDVRTKESVHIKLDCPIREVRSQGNYIYLLTFDKIMIYDITHFRIVQEIPLTLDKVVSTFAVHAPGFDRYIRMLICTMDGCVYHMEVDKQTHERKMTTYWESETCFSRDCFLDGYKCVLAQNNGNIIIGDCKDANDSYEMTNVFDPTFFSRMQVTHKKLFVDGTPSGFEYRDWFGLSKDA